MFSVLKIQLVRFAKTGNIGAFVIQSAADGEKKGKNLLGGRNVRRIETAKTKTKLLLGRDCEAFEYDVQASPDLIRKSTKGIKRPRKEKAVDLPSEAMPWD